MTYATYTEAADHLPPDAKWVASYGYPKCPGFEDFFCDGSGRRWIISNGPWHALSMEWSVKTEGEA